MPAPLVADAFPAAAEVVEASLAAEDIAFPPFPAAEVVEASLAAEDVAFPPFPAAAEEADSVAADESAVSTTSGPAATAEAARPAAAIPPDPSLAAVLMVVPEPETTNFVQSSDVPRWATGMRTG